jgi:hypothetical protein
VHVKELTRQELRREQRGVTNCMKLKVGKKWCEFVGVDFLILYLTWI